MEKCRTCIWSDWSSGTKVYCPFSRCVKPKKKEEVTEEPDELEEERNIDEDR